MASVADSRFVSVWQIANECIRVRFDCRAQNLGVGGIQAAIADIFADAPTEQIRVLTDPANLPTPVVEVEFRKSTTVHADLSAGWFIEPAQQADECGLAGPRSSNDSGGGAEWNSKSDILERGLLSGAYRRDTPLKSIARRSAWMLFAARICFGSSESVSKNVRDFFDRGGQGYQAQTRAI